MQEILLKKVQTYLWETLNLTVKPEIWEGVAIPIYLQQQYNLYLVLLLKRDYLLVCPKNNVGDSPAVQKKQLSKIEEVTGYPVILLANEVSSYNRKRMIEQKISFIVPGNQMYLPGLGIDLREYFRISSKKVDRFSPSTQAIIIHAILNREYHHLTTKALKKQTGYSIMTLNRVFDELLEQNLVEAESVKLRERVINFTLRGRELWGIVNPMLRNPVNIRKWVWSNVHLDERYKLAGLSALAMQTMLAEPMLSVIAMTNDEFKPCIKNQEIREVRESSEANYQVEIWSYNPKNVCREAVVDTLSLCLSLKDEQEARTLGEIEVLMEKVPW